MPWTESRSREEWLAEVQRRGIRIRRRRRVGFGVVGALALVLPVSVTASVVRSGSERAVELSVAGPAPAGGGEAPATGLDAPGQPPPVEELATTTTVPELPPETIPRQLVPETTVRASVAPALPGPVPPADDPVVRSPTTLPPPPTTTSSTVAPKAPGGPVSSTLAASAPPALPACAAQSLQIDVVPSKATFALGETARGTFFVQTYKAVDCLVSMPTSFRIENVATGAVVGSVPSIYEGPNPIRADGKMFTTIYAWDQQDCSGPACTQVPPGLYQAVAQWADGSPYRGWGEFRIGG